MMAVPCSTPPDFRMIFGKGVGEGEAGGAAGYDGAVRAPMIRRSAASCDCVEGEDESGRHLSFLVVVSM